MSRTPICGQTSSTIQETPLLDDGHAIAVILTRERDVAELRSLEKAMVQLKFSGPRRVDAVRISVRSCPSGSLGS